MEDQQSNPGIFTRISGFFRKAGLEPDDANNLTEDIYNMASANVLDRIDTSNAQVRLEMKTISKTLESKIDSQNSKIDSQNSKYNLLIGLVTGGLTVIVALLIAIIGWLLNNGSA